MASARVVFQARVVLLQLVRVTVQGVSGGGVTEPGCSCSKGSGRGMKINDW